MMCIYIIYKYVYIKLHISVMIYVKLTLTQYNSMHELGFFIE